MMSEWCAAGKCVNLGGVDSAAQTYCDHIYVSDSYKPNDADQVVLLAHELRHSQQCREKGGEGKFGFHYFKEYKRANQSYENNSMEIEAENTAKDFAKNVICAEVGCDRSTRYYENYNEWGIDLPVSLIAASTSRFQPGFYSRIGMNPPGIIYLWPSPWDGGKTDVWCDVPNHTMYIRPVGK